MHLRFIKLLRVLAIIGTTSLSLSASAVVRGHVDSVKKTKNKIHIAGWACQVKSNRSIQINLHGGAIKQPGAFIKTIPSNMKSEKGVANACQTNYFKHRFNTSLTNREWFNFQNQKIHIFGFSDPKGTKTPLIKSGLFTLPKYTGPTLSPTPPTTPIINQNSQIKGYIDDLRIKDGKLTAFGWACTTGVNQSIQVKLYAGGDQNSGSLLSTAIANLVSGEHVANTCRTNLDKHRFESQIPANLWKTYQNKRLYIHGLYSNKHNLLPRSGTFTIPKTNTVATPVKPPINPNINPKSQIKGHIDSLRIKNGKLTAFGWACSSGIKQSVQVKFYAGGNQNSGALLKTITANNTSEKGVANACGSNFYKHRFATEFSENLWKTHQNKKLYAHGISLNRNPNNQLGKSGSFTIPKNSSPVTPVNPTPSPSTQIKGYIDSLSIKNGKLTAYGWACSKGINQSIQVKLYAGGDQNSGSLLSTTAANAISGEYVANTCGTKLGKHRFQTEIPKNLWATHQNKRLYIHGIFSNNSKLIQRSGFFMIPKNPNSTTPPVNPPKPPTPTNPNINPNSQTKGHIDSLRIKNGKLTAFGWACSSGIKQSVQVKFYAGGNQNSGVLLKTITANNTSEKGVANACGSNFYKHRFATEFSENLWKTHQNKKLYAHGISLNRNPNNQLGKSGQFTIPRLSNTPGQNPPPVTPPTPTVGPVIGKLLSVSTINNAVTISGWACQTKLNKSLDIQVYVDNPNNSNNLIIEETANSESNSIVKNSCNNSHGRNQFTIILSENEWKSYQNKKVYIRGLSSTNNSHKILEHSGSFIIPKYIDLPINNNIIGAFDGIDHKDNNITLRGWTCEKKNKNSLKANIYFGTSSANMRLIHTGNANKDSEKGVNGSCQSTGTKFRFNITLASSFWNAHQGQNIYIKGSNHNSISPLLKKSGEFKVPSSRKISSLPKTGPDLIIPAGKVFELDKSIDVRELKIMGTLVCPSNKNLTIVAQAISVMGRFDCGSKNNPFIGNLDIKLKEGYTLRGMKNMPMGQRAFVSHMGGQIHFYGKQKLSRTKLSKTATKGMRTLSLENSVNWSVNDKIVVTSSSMDMNEAEQFRIVSISSDKRSITLNTPLKHLHNGVTYGYKKGSSTITLDERSIVANLTRNIKISSFQGDFQSSLRGAHMMIMGTGKAYIDSVEFEHMGRMGELGRYPFHWHLAGNATGQFIKNSAISNSFQRCIVVHHTNSTLVDNNNCYNHFGHGYFFESGTERNNVMKRNLGLISKKVPANRALLESDFKGTPLRFPAPSTYWVSNPDNEIYDNIASGSEGTGFWMAFSTKKLCNPSLPGDCSVPARMNTKKFDSNIAHSSSVGITWDGAPNGSHTGNKLNPEDFKVTSSHYAPPKKPLINKMTAYKNSGAGIYTRADAMVFTNAILADNLWNLFLAYSQQFKNSHLIGMSPNFVEKDKAIIASKPNVPTGVILYDGPFELNNVNFFDYPSTDVYYGSKKITPIPFTMIGGANRFENKVKGLHFDPEPRRRVWLNYRAKGWADSPYTVFIRDIDGSLTGIADTLVTPDHPLNNHPSCIKDADQVALFCDYDPGVFIFSNKIQYNSVYFKVMNPNGARGPQSFNAGTPYHNKMSVKMGDAGIYTLTPMASFSHQRQTRTTFQSEGKRISPILKVQKMIDAPNMAKCRLEGGQTATKVGSLAALKATTDKSAYFTTAGDFYYRIMPYAKTSLHRNSDMSNSWSGSYLMNCL